MEQSWNDLKRQVSKGVFPLLSVVTLSLIVVL